jgi:hypothetical protein
MIRKLDESIFVSIR